MLTGSRHLDTTLAVVAVFAHARCVVNTVDMGALSYLIAVLDLFVGRGLSQRFVNLCIPSLCLGLAYSFLGFGWLGLGLLISLWFR